MTQHFVLELVGYTASVLIAISLMMSSIVRLRVINLIGALGFSLYGLLINAYPVAILNGSIALVNIYHLVRMARTKEYFQLLQLKPDSVYLPYFLQFHAEEIRRILPDFQYHPSANHLALFILRDCNPAGVFIAEQKPDGVLRVLLDFTIPNFRDLKMGKFLFVDQAAFFRDRGIREIIISPRTKEFGAYLLKVGFVRTGHHEDAFHIHFADQAG